MKLKIKIVPFAMLYFLCAAPFAASDIPSYGWFPKSPPLLAPQGKSTTVSTVEELFTAVGRAQPGETIFLQDGVYHLPRVLEIRTDGVTLRSVSGNRHAVILDGGRSRLGELVSFRRCSDVTVADFTIQNVLWNGFKINSDDNVQRLTIRNCVIHNIWQRGVKGVTVPAGRREEIRPKGCRVEYCLFYNDHAKRFEDDPSDTPQTFGGNYIGGIDTMFAKNWTIRGNVFINIQGRTREGRGCVFMWHHAEGCVIEGNIIVDCDVGIALGNSSGIGAGMSSVHGTGMIVRNNFITRAPESGIVADYTRDCVIVNNTVFDPQNRLRRLLRVVHDSAGLEARNNLFSGTGISIESQDDMTIENNLLGNYSACFRQTEQGDLHLAKPCEAIVDRGIVLENVKEDIDGQARQDAPDIGADEWEPVPSSVP